MQLLKAAIFGVLIFGGAACSAVWAQTPKVVADIAPVHSLVAMVMQDVGTPDLLAEAGQSPHAASLRPAAAKALSQADLVVWIGPEFEPWLEKSIASLSGNDVSLALLEQPQTHRLPYRDGGMFDGHAEEGSDHDHNHEHGEDAVDPHAWLDPVNAGVWVDLIAEKLAMLDPGNAAHYRANAKRAQDELDQLRAEVQALLSAQQGVKYLVYHDAFQYFGERFHLPALAAISGSDARAPGARRISDLRAALEATQADCAVTEPQFDTRLMTTVAGEGIPLVVVDPLGSTHEAGPGLYAETLRDIARNLAACQG